jgi:hypothetical protein
MVGVMARRLNGVPYWACPSAAINAAAAAANTASWTRIIGITRRVYVFVKGPAQAGFSAGGGEIVTAAMQQRGAAGRWTRRPEHAQS